MSLLSWPQPTLLWVVWIVLGLLVLGRIWAVSLARRAARHRRAVILARISMNGTKVAKHGKPRSTER